MAKLTKHYHFIYSFWLQGLPTAAVVYRFFYPETAELLFEKVKQANQTSLSVTHNFTHPHLHRPTQHSFLGSLQPIAAMVKDFIDTFKPYKSNYYLRRDFYQPLFGFGNLMTGTAKILLAPLFFFTHAITALLLTNKKTAGGQGFRFYSKLAGSWFVEGIMTLLRGATQVVTTPLTWLLKIPLRYMIGAYIPPKLIESSQRIQELMIAGHSSIMAGDAAQFDSIRHQIHHKFRKGLRRGRLSYVHELKEQSTFDALSLSKPSGAYKSLKRADKTAAALHYLGLFSLNIPNQMRSVLSPVVESTSPLPSPLPDDCRLHKAAQNKQAFLYEKNNHGSSKKKFSF